MKTERLYQFDEGAAFTALAETRRGNAPHTALALQAPGGKLIATAHTPTLSPCALAVCEKGKKFKRSCQER